MKIKTIPEDFVVEEVLNLTIEEGPYFYYRMTKKNWNTLDVLREVKKRLRVKHIGYAGIKDKVAVTSQYISVKKEIGFEIKDVSFTFVGKGKQSIYLGMLEGNTFTLTLRNLEKELGEVTEIVNLFGPQRFSTKNVAIGKTLVKKEFKEACSLLDLDVENNNYIGALQQVGKDKLQLFIHAYQSYLWNKVAIHSTKKVLPILGFLTEGDDYDEIMKEEDITKKSFLTRSLPHIAAEGSERERVIPVKNFKTLEFTDDDLFPGKKKQVISFFLAKGAYATVVLENLLNK